MPDNEPPPAADPTPGPADAPAADALPTPVGTHGDDNDLLSADFIRKLDQMSLASKKIFAGRMKGERRSPRRGQSVEFADFRNYVPGDDLRFIDWNVYARLDKIFLKLFVEEEDLHVNLILDCSASMAYGEPEKLLYGKRIAAALGYITLRNQDRLSLHTAREHLDVGVTGLRGRRAAHRLFSFLQDVRGDGRTNLHATLREFALRKRGKGVVVLISDFLDKRGYDEALRFLQMGSSDVIVIHVLAPDEISPDLTEDLRLVDLEDGTTVEVSKSDVLARQYKATLQTFCEDLKETCLRRDMVYCYAVTEQPFEELVTKTLRSRGVLG